MLSQETGPLPPRRQRPEIPPDALHMPASSEEIRGGPRIGAGRIDKGHPRVLGDGQTEVLECSRKTRAAHARDAAGARRHSERAPVIVRKARGHEMDVVLSEKAVLIGVVRDRVHARQHECMHGREPARAPPKG